MVKVVKTLFNIQTGQVNVLEGNLCWKNLPPDFFGKNINIHI